MGMTHRLDHEPFLVRPGKSIRLKDHDPRYTAGFQGKADAHEALLEDVTGLAAAQDLLWASKQYSVIIIFQALDAAGKDGTIKHVMSGVNPQGVDVFSFKAPSTRELAHDYLWRCSKALPERGRIGIFNRSYYEELTVVRIHERLLESERLPRQSVRAHIWQERFEDIVAFERHLHRNGTLILKFFLHLSKREQRKRLLERIDTPEKNWKISPADIRERAFWDDYQTAYGEMLTHTSTGFAPWYVIPADHKWFVRAAVANTIVTRLEALDLAYPCLTGEQRAELLAERKTLLRRPR